MPKDQSRDQEKKEECEWRKCFGIDYAPATRSTGYGSEIMRTLKIKFYHGIIWCRKKETKKFFSSAPLIALKLTISLYFQILQQVSADRLRLQTHSRFKRSYDKNFDKLLLGNKKIIVSHLLAISSEC